MKFNKVLILIVTLIFFIIPMANADTAILYVDDFSGSGVEWDTESGASPYLNNSTANYIHEVKTSNALEYTFYFENITSGVTIDDCVLYIECEGDDTNDRVQPEWTSNDGLTSWQFSPTAYVTVNQNSYDWETLNIYSHFNNDTDINEHGILLRYLGVAGGDDIRVRRMYMNVTYTSPVANSAPINYQLSVTDMDDTDNLYAEKKFYTLDYDGYDENGYADIHEIYFMINQSSTSRAVFKYDEDIDSFSSVSGNWEIDAGSSTATRSGTDINITLKFMPSWDAIEESDIEFEARIFDDEPSSDWDVMQTNYADVITTLITGTIECTDVNNPDRVSVDVSSQIDFQVYYIDNPSSGTPSNDYPPDAEFTSISIYDSSDNNEGTDSSIINGAGSVSFSESTVQSENYNLYININDGDYVDGELSTTENIIWDRIKILTLGANDDRIDIDVNGTWYATAELEYDNHPLGAGDWFILSVTHGFTWNGTYFISSENRTSVQLRTINSYSLGSESTYGITAGNINGLSQGIIWDEIVFYTGYTLDVDDDRINYNSNGSWHVRLMLDYDNTEITTGTVSLSIGSMIHNGTYWRYQYSRGSVGFEAGYVSAVNDGVYGITAIDFIVSTDSESIIYDKVVFLTSYTFDIDDGRINYDYQGLWKVRLMHDYDDTEITTASILLNTGSMVRNGTYFTYKYSRGSVGLESRNIVAVSSLPHGISVVDSTVTSDSEDVIFDRLLVTFQMNNTSPVDNDVNVGFTVDIQYEYDSVNCTNYNYDINRNATPLYTDRTVRRFTESHSNVVYEYDVLNVEDLQYGITVFVDDSNLIMEWYSPVGNSIPLNFALSITDMDDTDNLYAEKKFYTLDYDGYDANGYANISYVKIYINQSGINRAIFNYNEDTDTFSLISGNWEIDIGGSSASKSSNDLNLTFKIMPSWNALEESDIEIEAKITDIVSVDRDIMQTNYADTITTLITTSIEGNDANNPDRLSTGYPITIDFQVNYADNPSSGTPSDDYPPDAEFTGISIYDSSDNNEGTDSSIVNGAGSVLFVESTVHSENYNLYVDINDADYTDGELTTTETVIWDRIKILTFTVEDDRVNVNDNGVYLVTAELEYDNHPLGSGDSLFFSGDSPTQFFWNGTYFKNTENYGIVRDETYDTYQGANEATYNIVSMNMDGKSGTIIWDRIRILSLQVNDPRINILSNGTYSCIAELEYDNHTLGINDTLTLSNELFTWNGTLFTHDEYRDSPISQTINTFTSGNEATYGITSGNINNQTVTEIWDYIKYYITVNTTTPISDTPVQINLHAWYVYDDVNVTNFEWDVTRNFTSWKDNLTSSPTTDVNTAPTRYRYSTLTSGITDLEHGLTYVQLEGENGAWVQWEFTIVVGDITLLFGGGFNHTTPYIYLRWNYTGSVDNYEIVHSTDGISYSTLVLTPDKYYNHTGLTNGTYHWYKVRSTYFNAIWYNSSLSLPNLERVWFIHGTGGGTISGGVHWTMFLLAGIPLMFVFIGGKK